MSLTPDELAHLTKIAARPPAIWIGHTTRTTPRPGTVHWCFTFNPPPGFRFFAPEALLVWPPVASITIPAIRFGLYDATDWKAVCAAEQDFGSTVAVACAVQPLSLEHMPVFGTTETNRQLEVQLDIEDGLDVERVAVLVRGRPMP